MARPRNDVSGLVPMRACHDCGKPTRDYRCPACHRKHLARWRASLGMRGQRRPEEEDAWQVCVPPSAGEF